MPEKIYTRDKRSPIPKNKNVSKVMSANKYKNSKPELVLRQAIWKAGLKGYRLHNSKIPGRPDISFISKKIAVFVNGCFWHRCPYCNYNLPKHNTLFWQNKFENNIRRDYIKMEQLKKMNWEVLTIWECQIKTELDNCLRIIINLNSQLKPKKIYS